MSSSSTHCLIPQSPAMHTIHWVPLELHSLLPPGTGVSTGMHISCKSKNWLFIWTLQNKDGTIQTCPDPLLFPKDYSVLTTIHTSTHIPRVTCCRHSGRKKKFVPVDEKKGRKTQSKEMGSSDVVVDREAIKPWENCMMDGKISLSPDLKIWETKDRNRNLNFEKEKVKVTGAEWTMRKWSVPRVGLWLHVQRTDN